MKIFRNGNVMDYNGPRDKDGIVNFMRKQVGRDLFDKTG